MIKKCTCSHQYQDELYGKGMRVHTIRGKEKNVYNCTVCGQSHATRKMRSIILAYKPEMMEGKR